MNNWRSSNQRCIEENSTKVEGWGKQVCLKLFLESMDSGAQRNLDGQGIQMVRPVDLNPHEPNIVLTCGTQSRCVLEERRALIRNRAEWGWQIWWGYGVEWLKSQEGNLEVNASWDWKPVEVFQKEGWAGPWFGTHDNMSKRVLNSLYAK